LTVARALIIVDVQRDFLPGGALAVPDGDEVIAPIGALVAGGGFDVVLATRDWHPPDHVSFKSRGGPWPAHCVQGTDGAELDARLPLDRVDVVIDKGTTDDGMGYSAFESDALGTLVRTERIVAATIVGLATDYCVLHTARDAVREGLIVTVDRSAVRGIDADGSQRALDELAAAGAVISG
jgi:nicotinamidase/pyrazinamidase